MSLLASGHHNYINTNGVKLHYVTQGKGSLMLMLHGFPEFWYSWRHQIPEFAKYFQVVAVDLRGYNHSDKPKKRSAYVMDELVKDIEGIIKGLGYEKCILVGHDWGGAIAWNFAYTHPQMLEKLIVLNIPHPGKLAQGLGTFRQLLRSWYIFFFQLPFLPELFLQAGNYRMIEKTFKGTAIDKSSFTEEDIRAFKDAVSKPGALTAMLNYYRNIFNHKMLRKNCDIINIPTLMIWGENDTFFGKELTYETQRYVTNLQIKYVPNCSHWVQEEKPELANQYIREFLQLSSI